MSNKAKTAIVYAILGVAVLANAFVILSVWLLVIAPAIGINPLPPAL